MRRLLFICFSILVSMATSAFAQSAGALHVKLDGFRSTNGQAFCTVYNDAAAFPSHDEKAVKQGKTTSIKNASATVDFDGLAPGKYAMVCYHDENSNGKFDENALGMPKEGYCFSNNIKPRFSSPVFDQCAFDYKGGDQSIAIKMIY
jgi:uncharacterized protein (DUF2141 family)